VELVAGRRGSGGGVYGFVVIGAKREASGNEERRGRIGSWGVGSRRECVEKEHGKGAESHGLKLRAELGRMRKLHRWGGVGVILR
jgi:hypothetical protein